MKLLELYNDIDCRFERSYDKCNAFIESTINEYEISLHENCVFQEKQTFSSKSKKEDKAKEGLIVRLGKTIKHIYEKLAEWFRNKAKAFKEWLNSKKHKDEVKSYNDAIKNNPKLKNAMIQIPDVKQQKTSSDKILKMSKKNIDSARTKDIEKDIDRCDDELIKFDNTKKAITITVSVATALAFAKIASNELRNVEKRAEKDISDGVSNFIIDDEDLTPENIENIAKANMQNASVLKHISSNWYDTLHNIYDNIYHTVKHEKTIDPDFSSMESTDFISDDLMDEYVQESYINSILSEINTDKYDNSIDRYERYLESVENEIWNKDLVNWYENNDIKMESLLNDILNNI